MCSTHLWCVISPVTQENVHFNARGFRRNFIRKPIIFFLNNNADRHPSSRNTHQEYSFHLYCGGARPTKHPISTILCNYAPASGKSRPVSPDTSQSWFKRLDSLHLYSIGAAIRKGDQWNSMDGPKWRHTLTSVQIHCTIRWNYAGWGQIWTYKKKKKKKKKKKRL